MGRPETLGQGPNADPFHQRQSASASGGLALIPTPGTARSPFRLTSSTRRPGALKARRNGPPPTRSGARDVAFKARWKEHGRAGALLRPNTAGSTQGRIQRGLEDRVRLRHPRAEGRLTEGAGPGIDVYSMRQPLSCRQHHAVQFPMIPMWCSASPSLGNGFILKPSEGSVVPVRLAELMLDGAPANVERRHGDKEAVTPSSPIPTSRRSASSALRHAHYIYSHGTATISVRAMGSAKNHGVVMPDAAWIRP